VAGADGVAGVPVCGLYGPGCTVQSVTC